MSIPPELEGDSFTRYRRYLQFLARSHLASRYQNRIEPSDIVQQTMLQAHAARHQFRGTTEQEKLGWLRTILINTVTHAVRDLHAQCRDVKRERSIEEDIETSSVRLVHFLAIEAATPSEQLCTQESGLELANAIEELPEMQRQALLLKYWQQRSLQEIAVELDTSVPAVAGLLHRATRKLRKHVHL